MSATEINAIGKPESSDSLGGIRVRRLSSDGLIRYDGLEDRDSAISVELAGSHAASVIEICAWAKEDESVEARSPGGVSPSDFKEPERAPEVEYPDIVFSRLSALPKGSPDIVCD